MFEFSTAAYIQLPASFMAKPGVVGMQEQQPRIRDNLKPAPSIST